MNKEKQKDFTMRITQANRTELVVITYDIIAEEIEEADRQYEAGNIDEYRRSVKSAQKFVADLMSALDYTYPISAELLRLYEYVQRLLIKSDVSGKPHELKSAENVIAGLRKAFAKLAESDDSAPLMENTQSVFAGLTYGKGSLNETDLDPNASNRGFLA
ncbi:MAG: flagellar protein FliS [Lachnospiraceae bacterium]|nr:flagellar protein FliS [Lachnospiraceae bacterium]